MKKLYKSKSDHMLCGVCSGMGDYFDVDVNIVRLLFVLGTFFYGAGLIIYAIGSYILPWDE